MIFTNRTQPIPKDAVATIFYIKKLLVSYKFKIGDFAVYKIFTNKAHLLYYENLYVNNWP